MRRFLVVAGLWAGSTVAATKEGGEPNHVGNAGGRSIWYRFTATASGTVTVETLGSRFDTLLAVYTGGSVGSLTQVAANDDANGTLQSRVQFVATANTVYRIAVDGWNGASGSVTLSAVFPVGIAASTASASSAAPALTASSAAAAFAVAWSFE